MTPVGVLIAEDDPGVRALLGALIRRDASLELVGTAADAETAIELAGRCRPDVALLDVHMPGGGGVRATREILRCSPGTRVVALSGSEDRRAVLEMLGGGAVSYLVKGLPPEELVAAIRRAARGQSVLSPSVASSLVDELATKLRREEREARARRARLARVEELLELEFEVALQPVIELESGSPQGFEALARFPLEPERGPAFWFAEAEAVGHRGELELKALGLALTRLGNLPAAAFLALNVSPELLASPGLVALLAGVPLPRLVLELTEHAPVGDYDALERALAPLRAGGARVAIDDAGAGFASLRHILRLKPDLIKLDISLTREIDRDRSRRALASALIAFAAETEATIVAEGIETRAELEALHALGVRFGQGYYLAKPALLAVAA